MKKIFATMAAAMIAISTPVVADEGGPGGFVPPTSGPYANIAVYYNEMGEVSGWDTTYCDGSVESVRYPGMNLWSISFIQGSCLPPLP